MDALKYLQKALDAGTVRMQRCEIYPNLRVLVDEPNGDLRLTYAKVIAGTVQSIAVFVLTKSVGRVGRFSLGFAVNESRRGRGLGKEIVVQAIDELFERHDQKRDAEILRTGGCSGIQYPGESGGQASAFRLSRTCNIAGF